MGSAEAHFGSHFKLVNQAHPLGLAERTSLNAYTDATRVMHADFAACLQDGAVGAVRAPANGHWLMLCCIPWRHDNVHGRDVRKLGIPIISVELHPLI